MKKLFIVLITIVYVSGVASAGGRFAGLDKELKAIAYKNYGRKVVRGYKIGIAFQDMRTGYRLSVNGNSVFPAASIIKLPVMAFIYSLADNGKISLNQKIRFKDRDKLPGAGVLQWLRPTSYKLWNLCGMMISLSDNTATRLCVMRVGKTNINKYCKRIGLYRTRILDETALAEAPKVRINTTTPLDILMLLARIEKGSGFSSLSKQQMLSFMFDQKYRFGIPRVLPSNVRCANKTGNLKRVLHDAAVVYTPRGTYVLCVFTKGFVRDRQAKLAINDVSAAVYRYYALK
ncbi:MAG: serine hydrolase [Candidatus Margulisiibacteriota bacterium]